MKHFEYDPIDLESPSFRLIRLLRGRYSKIECEIFHAQLDVEDRIEYEALSYVWGSLEKQCTISINDCQMNVTANLYLALLNLRWLKQDRILWIDAISINQNDSRERGHQVRKMAEIYKSAHQVIIWLGPSNYETAVIMRAIRQLQTESLKHTTQDWGVSDQRWKEIWTYAQTIPEVEPGRGLIHQSLETLLARPWFERVWILQEIAHSQRAIFACGNEMVTAYFLAIIPSLLEVMPNSQQQAVLDIVPGCPRTASWWSKRRNLHTLLKKFRNCKASDERDKIYALLSMSTDARDTPLLQVDYNKSVKEVVKDTLAFLLSSYNPNRTSDLWPNWDMNEFLGRLDCFNDDILLLDLLLRVKGNQQAISTLLAKPKQNNMERRDINGRTWLWYAVHQGYDAAVRALIKDGANINIKDNAGITILNCAYGNGDAEMIRTLINGGANINQRLNRGVTCLSDAVSRGDKEMIQLILKHGGDTNMKSEEGDTPIFKAVSKNYVGIALILIQHGADVNVKDMKGETPLFKLRPYRSDDMIQLLVSSGADINAMNTNGETPLFRASSRGFPRVVKQLIRNGANVRMKNKIGNTPLSEADRRRRKGVVRLLIENGAATDK